MVHAEDFHRLVAATVVADRPINWRLSGLALR
jgi:hypothetical protein